VIAVTGLAGHAFELLRNHQTLRMWLKDFLPLDIKNIRTMSYGYVSNFIGQGATQNRLLDYQRFFIQDIENARNGTNVSL